jgi:enoyl-CoA hydratase
MTAEHALIERRGHVLIVTMNRPEARNALSGPMMALMRQAWDTVDSDPGIRVCVLTGAGGAFCAGADLKAMNSDHPGSRVGDVSVIEALLKGRRLTKPLIAAVEGPAIAGGTEILQACDIRVAGAGARFGVSEARWGLFPLGGSSVRLPRQIPYTVAADLLLTGRHISAAEALSFGLIGHVVPDGQALARALEIADVIAANGPVAVRAILRVIRETEGMAEDDAFVLEAKVGMSVFASSDAREGPRAFAEKRRPEFQDRLPLSRSCVSARGRAERGEGVGDHEDPGGELVQGRRAAAGRGGARGRRGRLDDLAAGEDPLEVGGADRVAERGRVDVAQRGDRERGGRQREADVRVGQLGAQPFPARDDDRAVVERGRGQGVDRVPFGVGRDVRVGVGGHQGQVGGGQHAAPRVPGGIAAGFQLLHVRDVGDVDLGRQVAAGRGAQPLLRAQRSARQRPGSFERRDGALPEQAFQLMVADTKHHREHFVPVRSVVGRLLFGHARMIAWSAGGFSL